MSMYSDETASWFYGQQGHQNGPVDFATLRDMLARHRNEKSCASCHARFDALGLVFEGYGPVGERREKDLAGRAVDARATFPGGMEGEGFAGLKNYIREKRQGDFVAGFCRKLLAYALGRSLIVRSRRGRVGGRVR